MRIVSLLASATEIVCALGAGEMLVGRSHECDNLEWVRRLPACSAPAFDVSVSSGEIDAEVRRRLRSGEPLYHIHGELIRELRADLLITQSHCFCLRKITPRSEPIHRRSPPSPQVDPVSSLWETVANPTFEEVIPPDISYQAFSNEQKYP